MKCLCVLSCVGVCCVLHCVTIQWTMLTAFHTQTQTKVWWHHVFFTPAVSILLSNNGLMDQLQILLASSSPSACPPPALLCYSHLLLSSLLTLQHFHSTKVTTNIKPSIYHTGERPWIFSSVPDVLQKDSLYTFPTHVFVDDQLWIIRTCNMFFSPNLVFLLAVYLFSLPPILYYLRSKSASIGIWRQLCSDCLFTKETLTISFWVTNKDLF